MNATTNETKGMSRSTDPPTSADAAESIFPKLESLQWTVWDAMKRLHVRNGARGVTPREVAEYLWEADRARPNVRRRSENTFRRRCTELAELGVIEESGETRNRGTVFIPLTEKQFHEKQSGGLF